ncbi:MAG: transposase [Desulfomonilaceae bacterium]
MRRKRLGKVFHELAWQKESTIVEGHLRPDHIHMCVRQTPYLMSQMVASAFPLAGHYRAVFG